MIDLLWKVAVIFVEKLRIEWLKLQIWLWSMFRGQDIRTVRAVETLEKEPECVPGRHLLDVAIDVIERMKREPMTLLWTDQEDEWSERICAAFPSRSQSFKEYAIATQMIGNRRSKGSLVALVNWLLVENRLLAERLKVKEQGVSDP